MRGKNHVSNEKVGGRIFKNHKIAGKVIVVLSVLGIIIVSTVPIRANVKDNLDSNRFSAINKRITALETTVDEVFRLVSNGKKLIASTLTDYGIATADDATFNTMQANIDKLAEKKLEEGKAEGGTVIAGLTTSDGKRSIACGNVETGNLVTSINLPISDPSTVVICKPSKIYANSGNVSYIYSATANIAGALSTQSSIVLSGSSGRFFDACLRYEITGNKINVYKTGDDPDTGYAPNLEFSYCSVVCIP